MSFAALSIKGRFTAPPAVARRFVQLAVLAAIHLAAIGIMLRTEVGLVEQAAFALTWGLIYFFWLAVLRRPAISAALTLGMFVILILLSQFKYNVLMTTVTFVDVMIVDSDTLSFLMMIFPGLGWKVAIAALIVVPTLISIWLLDTWRVRSWVASSICATCFVVLAGLSFAIPLDRNDEFWSSNYVSKFARSGVVATVDLLTRGVFESDTAVADPLRPAAGGECRLANKPPHIIMIFDESSFDARLMPGIQVPPDYPRQFLSFDGKARSFVVEGASGPSWFTEYNVLTGLSVRSYGRFAESVTRIASGRIERGLPHTLRRCGYSTFSLYPWTGAFLSARGFQTTAGIEHFLDAKDMGTRQSEPDSFYYDFALRLIAREQSRGPLFLFVYTAANHFPWSVRYRPELAPDWRDPGNWFDIDEYLRRQSMSAKDYEQLVARLAKEFPDESFLLVRFGDHQPLFAKFFIEPDLDQTAVARQIAQFDPRYFTTYYAIDTVNFRPADLSSALDTLDAPYLPLVVLEAAGVPLDASFAEQKTILQRCRGLFYLCADGAEARRFNRQLMDAGLIKGF